ncbi:MAG: polyprenol monophosphomannose synthase [Flavobacteriales bacterium]|nr:polyprenol monophosphomannose synthase [Flavobacteriales bacterium]
MNDSLVIIPTYNEKENIEKIIRKVISMDEKFDILVVDDGSPDGTGNIVKTLQEEFSELNILERTEKNGLGSAYIAGFKWALEKGYKYIFEMDADFSHDPEDLKRLRQACKDGADMSIGSRYVKGGSISNWPLIRLMISYFGSMYARSVLWMGIKDTTAGFKCYTNKVLSAISLDKVKFVGYAFQIEMKYRAYKKGFKIVEVPITFKDRTEGRSKMGAGIMKEGFLGVLKLRISNLG